MNFKDTLEKIHLIADTLSDDDPEKVELLNIEADYGGLMDWALEKHNLWVSHANGAKELAAKYTARRTSLENRAKAMKNVMLCLLNCANEQKYAGKAGAASVRKIAPKPVVQDEKMLSKEYKKMKEEIDKAKINEDIKQGVVIDGVILDNGRQSVTVRT